MEDPSPLAEQQRIDGHEAKSPILVYTAVSRGYDKRWQPQPPKGVEFEWREPTEKWPNLRLWNRYEKIKGRPHDRTSMYLDGSMRPKRSLKRTVDELIGDAHLAVFRHPHRSCVYEEIEACVARHKITREDADQALRQVKRVGVPKDFGLWACGVVLRRPGSDWLEWFESNWWADTKSSGLVRDQIWFAVNVYELGYRDLVRTIDADIFNNKWFQFHGHCQANRR